MFNNLTDNLSNPNFDLSHIVRQLTDLNNKIDFLTQLINLQKAVGLETISFYAASNSNNNLGVATNITNPLDDAGVSFIDLDHYNTSIGIEDKHVLMFPASKPSQLTIYALARDEGDSINYLSFHFTLDGAKNAELTREKDLENEDVDYEHEEWVEYRTNSFSDRCGHYIFTLTVNE